MKTTHPRVEPGTKEVGGMVAIKRFMEGTDPISPEGGRVCSIGELSEFTKSLTPEEKAEFAKHSAENIDVELKA